MTIESTAISGVDNVLRVAVAGKVYADGATALETELLTAIHEGAKHLVLDLTRLELIDSSGLSAIITAIKELRTGKKGVIVAYGLSESIAKIFTLTKIDKFIRPFASEGDAVAHLRTLP